MKDKNLNEKICNADNASQARSLAKDATVSCGLCGAKAHEPANVCDPVQISGAGTRRK